MPIKNIDTVNQKVKLLSKNIDTVNPKVKLPIKYIDTVNQRVKLPIKNIDTVNQKVTRIVSDMYVYTAAKMPGHHSFIILNWAHIFI